MKTTILFALSFFLYLNAANSQVTIECPADLTVTQFELNPNYDSYGDPNVTSVNGHTLSSNLTFVGNGCEGGSTTINYEASENSTGNTASCVQVISIVPSTLSEIQWPEQVYELTSGSPEDLDPEVSLSRPEPYEKLLDGSANILITYNDQVLTSDLNLPYKVVRTWTGLDWCTAETSSFVQVLKIQSVVGGALSSLSIPTCGGSTTTSLDINIFTSQSGFDLDVSNCTFSNNDLTGYMNCIAENNDIDPDSDIILEVISNNDFLNGVSTLDLVVIQRHILGINPILDECKLAASDVNGDGYASAIDLITMRKLILGIIPNLPSSPSWKVYNTNIYNDNLADEDKDLSFKKSEFPLQNLELIAVKIGDVNGSAN